MSVLAVRRTPAPLVEAHPAPVRNEGELWAPQTAVSLVEAGDYMWDMETRTPPWINKAFAQVASPLDDFIKFGQSSLTPYEAVTLGNIVLNNGPGKPEVIAEGGLTLGDRVALTSASNPGLNSEGIVVGFGGVGRGGVGTVRVMTSIVKSRDFPDARTGLKVDKVLAGALNDGRLVVPSK